MFFAVKYLTAKLVLARTENLLVEAHILPFADPQLKNPHFQFEIDGVSRRPKAFSVSAFHFLLLRGDRLQFLSALNGDLVQEELLRSGDGIPIDIIHDPSRNVSYVYTNQSIFQVGKNPLSI